MVSESKHNLLSHVGPADIINCLRKDRRRIILAGILIAVLAAIAGRVTQSAKSTAQLLYAPSAPLRSMGGQDALEKILDTPIDMKSIGLFCTSDETYGRTLEAVNRKGAFERPLKLDALKKSLKYKITVAKETPYDLVYTPIIELTAKARTPAQAKIVVDEWATQCQEAGQRYQEMFQTAAEESLGSQVRQLFEEYQDDQQAYAEFQKQNIIELYRSRITGIIATINGLEQSRDALMQNLVNAQAQIISTEEALKQEEKRLSVKWTAPEETLKQLSGILGLNDQASTGDSPANTLVEMEQLNSIYMELRSKLATAQIALASEKAELENVDKLIAARTAELNELQEKNVEAARLDSILSYEASISGNTYSSMLARAEQAKVALTLAQVPHLQVFAQGAEWPMSPYRHAVMFGIAGGILGLVGATLVSLMYRLTVQPSIEAQPSSERAQDVSYV